MTQTQNNNRNQRWRNRMAGQRRGVTLLFTIGLITLFVLLGTTFLVVSVHYMRGSRVHNIGRTQYESPPDQTDTVFFRLIRDTRDPQSSLIGASLKMDQHDLDNSFYGEVTFAYFPTVGGNATSPFHLPGDPNNPSPAPSRSLVILQIGPGLNLRQDAPYVLSDTTGAYNGQYITFLDGPAKGTTARIAEYFVHVDPSNNNNLIRQFVIQPENADIAYFLNSNPSATIPNGGLVGGRVIINSRSFNGRGVGYPVAGHNPNLNQAQFTSDALLPNRREYYRTTVPPTPGRVPSNQARVAPRNSLNFYYGLGHSNESYDAVDHQNLHLAGIYTDATGSIRIIPSFHRPALVRYWQNNSLANPNANQLHPPSNNNPDLYAPFNVTDQTDWDFNNGLFPLSYREFRRQVIMRPMPWDHPFFSGGNPLLVPQDTDNDGDVWMEGADQQPGFAGIDDDGQNGVDDPGELGWEGSDDHLDNDAQLLAILNGSAGFQVWDVDNDGDFVNDSIWIDPGLAIQVDRVGRHYKPLAAILVTDLDSRVNLNASGLDWHVANTYGVNAAGQPTTDGTATNFIFQRGQGYGPPEINLRSIFPMAANPANDDYVRLLYGLTAGNNVALDRTRGTLGRYGFDGVPGGPGMDPLMVRKLFEYPDPNLPYLPGNLHSFGSVGGAFGSHADLQGRHAVGIDAVGQPVFDLSKAQAELADSEYEMDLSEDGPIGNQSSISAIDQPFSAGELERILRGNDRGFAALPDRLWQLSDVLKANGSNQRLLVTTHSYDMPVPGESIFDRLHVVEEFRFRLGINNDGSIAAFRNGRPTYADWARTNLGLTNAQVKVAVNQKIREMLAPELILGSPLNVNRPFGDARDLNDNFVIDDHWESNDERLNEAQPRRSGDIETIFNIPFDQTNNGINSRNPNDNGHLARHLMARQLYILMMAMIDPNTTALDADGDNMPTVRETPFAIAQLAINMVDFRDADSIMTPFEFDSDPFDQDAWNVNGLMSDNTNDGPDREVVWGVERPELLITEAMATHDRRTEDTDTDGSIMDNNNPDEDFDQRLRPQGSLFFELYNPWTRSTRVPRELYDPLNPSSDLLNTEPFGVDLQRMSRASNGAPATPVWRIAIASPDVDNDRRQRFYDGRDKYLDPNQLNPNTAYRSNPNNIERTIYFANQAPNGPRNGRDFLPSATVLNAIGPIPPLGTAVVGSAGQQVSQTEYVTPFGRRIDADEAGGDLKYNETRSIWLDPGVSVKSIQPSLTNPMQMTEITKNCVAIPIDNLNISEPVNGYSPVNWLPGGAAGEGEYSPVIDVPFDENRNDPVFALDGTHRGYRILLLQRLANPFAPWHATQNPYMTIDSAHVDLHLFHGTQNVTRAEYQRIATLDNDTITWRMEFASVERGNQEVVRGRPPEQSRNLWQIEVNSAIPPRQVSYRPASDFHFFNYHLFESFTLNSPYLNDAWTRPRDYQRPDTRSGLPAVQRDKWSNPQNGSTIGFPWLTWNNRPYISDLEMMIVPRSSSSRLLYEFTLRSNLGGNSIYENNQAEGRYGHIPNFFSSAANRQGDESANLYKLFDFTHVPSRFVHTEEFQHIAQFQNLRVTAVGVPGNGQIGVLPYNAPFNYFHIAREPGKININTVNDPRVWEAIMGGPDYRWGGANPTNPGNSPGMFPNYQQLVQSRRGDAQTDPLAIPNSNVPTYVSKPFRDAGGGNLVTPGMPVRPDIESTLLRSNSTSPDPTQGNSIPQFDSLTVRTLLSNNNYIDFNDSNRNAYFREHSRFRLPNLVTTRSNVYAIWITVGYFEVDPVTGQLGQELGSDTGDIVRHRSFNIFDRSKPVGFEPGENHNVENAILVRRYIE